MTKKVQESPKRSYPQRGAAKAASSKTTVVVVQVLEGVGGSLVAGPRPCRTLAHTWEIWNIRMYNFT